MFIQVGKKLLNADHIASVEDCGNCVVVTGRTGHKSEYTGAEAEQLLAGLNVKPAVARLKEIESKKTKS